jgi:putative PIN family toxin of toxin-antitoxin system
MRSADRIVLDTSTLVSAMLKPESLPAQALTWAGQVGQPIASQETMDELARIVGRAQFDRYRAPDDRLRFLQLYRSMCEVIPVDLAVQACRDPNDDKFLSLAAAGGARVLVTGDQDLLVLKRFQSTLILTVRDFVQLCA